MSGHSHAKKIRHQKEITDQKRGQIFSKLSRQISVAAREGGEDPAANPKLRIAIEEARFFNLPKENIQRAIDRGVGKLPGIKLEQVTFEAYGPGGIALIIEGITDNKNRALSEVKQILAQNNGKLVDPGSVKWLFERKGVIEVRRTKSEDKEGLEILVIDAGAEDIYWHNAAHPDEPRQGRDILDIYTKIEDLDKVKKNLENQGIKIESASLDWVAKEQISVGEKERETAQKLFEALDESEAVQEMYSNLKV